MSKSQEDTIFDKILTGSLEAEKVYEDEDVLAFLDIHPAAPQHVLVIPKKKLVSFAEFTEAQPEDLGVFVQKIALVAERLGLKEAGYRVVFNHGRDGGQTVDYIHAHILGGRPLSWPPG